MSTPTSAQQALTKPNLANIPAYFRRIRGWVLHRAIVGKDGKLKDKVPHRPDGTLAESNNPATWSTYEEVVRAYRAGGYDGIGLMRNGDFVFIDLDGCVTDPKPAWAQKIIAALTGFAYMERSVSGQGVHIITRGKVPPGRRQEEISKKDHIGFAFYDGARYLTFSGDQLDCSTEPRDATPIITELHAELFPVEHVNGTRTAIPMSISDSEIIERARSSQNGAKFSRLWGGDFGDYPSQSEADLALCTMLAFWTGRDANRIDALFRQSGLMDGKWETRADYRDRTINKACANTTKVYAPRPSGVQPDIMFTPLDSADIVAVQIRQLRQALLRKPALCP
jgi:putative DNA primase/helicase